MPQPTLPYIIDVEASGFGHEGYPIEVGVVLAPGEKFCSLILPAPHWTHWDETAESVHNISRDILETYGNPIREVAIRLNTLLGNETVYSDGWVVDKPWLTQLFYASMIEPRFTISSLEMILSEDQMNIWHVTKDQVIQDLSLTRHRASFDAMIIQETYFRTLDKTR